MIDFLENDKIKYAKEHAECDVFYEQVVADDKEKFQAHYENWKEAVIRFQKLKQEDAIKTFLNEMNSLKFVNPETRINIFREIQQEQL